MEKLSGKPLEQLPFHDFTKVSDLVEYDGPIISQYRTPEGHDLVFYWVDYNPGYNRWLIFALDPETLQRYVTGNAAHREVMLIADAIYSVDINREGKYENVRLLTFEELPTSYMPELTEYLYVN